MLDWQVLPRRLAMQMAAFRIDSRKETIAHQGNRPGNDKDKQWSLERRHEDRHKLTQILTLEFERRGRGKAQS